MYIRKDDEITKGRAADKKKRRDRREGDRVLLLLLVEAWRDELPELVEDHRRRDEDAPHEGELDIGKKRLDGVRKVNLRRPEASITPGLDQGLRKKNEEKRFLR